MINYETELQKLNQNKLNLEANVRKLNKKVKIANATIIGSILMSSLIVGLPFPIIVTSLLISSLVATCGASIVLRNRYNQDINSENEKIIDTVNCIKNLGYESNYNKNASTDFNKTNQNLNTMKNNITAQNMQNDNIGSTNSDNIDFML